MGAAPGGGPDCGPLGPPMGIRKLGLTPTPGSGPGGTGPPGPLGPGPLEDTGILGPLVTLEEVVAVVLPVAVMGVAVVIGGVARAECGGVADEEGVELPELLLLDVAILLCRGLLAPAGGPPLDFGNGVVGRVTLLCGTGPG